MRGKINLFMVVLMLSFSFVFVSGVALDNGVINTLKSQDKARVIITYNGDVPLPDDIVSVPEINTFFGNLSQKEILDLSNNPNIKSIQLDWQVSIHRDEAIDLINSNIVNNIVLNNSNLTGKGQSICILDTGISYNHSDFGNCSLSEINNGTCDSILYSYNYINDSHDAYDDDGHGTHVAGIVKYVAPDSKLIIMKVCDSKGDCYISDLLSAVNFCHTWKDLYNISVISMSLGDEGSWIDDDCFPSDPLSQAINLASSDGLFITVASGNEGYDTGINYPACIGGSTSVGATTKFDSIVYFTNRYSNLDLLAPGYQINSSSPDGYSIKSGTSMATPFVAGSGALLFQHSDLLGLNLSGKDIETKLKNGGVLIDDWKRIDVFSSLDAGFECFDSIDCGPDLFIGEPYCNDSNLYQLKRIYNCDVGYCSSSNVSTLLESCSYGCKADSCIVRSSSGGGSSASFRSNVAELELDLNTQWNVDSPINIRITPLNSQGNFVSVDKVTLVLKDSLTSELITLADSNKVNGSYLYSDTPSLSEGKYTLIITAIDGYSSKKIETEIEVVKLSRTFSISGLGIDISSSDSDTLISRFISWLLNLF
jgi:hypothetical protein